MTTQTINHRFISAADACRFALAAYYAAGSSTTCAAGFMERFLGELQGRLYLERQRLDFAGLKMNSLPGVRNRPNNQAGKGGKRG